MGITIITAGCGGIGAELTKHLLEKGHTVIPTTRDMKNGLAFIKKLFILGNFLIIFTEIFYTA